MKRNYREVSNYVVIEGGRLQCMCTGFNVADDDNRLRHKSSKHLVFTLGSSKIIYESSSAFDLLNLTPTIVGKAKLPFLIKDWNGSFHLASGYDRQTSEIICESSITGKYRLQKHQAAEMWYPYDGDSWIPIYHWGGGLR